MPYLRKSRILQEPWFDTGDIPADVRPKTELRVPTTVGIVIKKEPLLTIDRPPIVSTRITERDITDIDDREDLLDRLEELGYIVVNGQVVGKEQENPVKVNTVVKPPKVIRKPPVSRWPPLTCC